MPMANMMSHNDFLTLFFAEVFLSPPRGNIANKAIISETDRQ